MVTANISMCGIDCGACTLGKELGCQGCKVQKGQVFWGECPLAQCCITKEVEHCGHCASFVCKQLNEFAYDKENGDNGDRIERLKKLISENKL